MPSPRPAPKPAPAPPASPAQGLAPVAAAGSAPDLLPHPELPEGISLRLHLGTVSSGDSIKQTVTAVLSDNAGTVIADSGPCLVDRSFNEAVAVAVTVAIGNVTRPNDAEHAPAPVAPAAAPAPPSDAAHQLLTQISGLPPEWQDYISQTFAAQFGSSLPSDPAALTQDQVAFTAALLPQ